jgi:hypothetical protein
MVRANERVRILLATARTNPEFARRLAEVIPAESRLELVEALARPAFGGSREPRLAKCGSAERRQSPMSTQLNAFARSVSRIA